MKRIDKKVTVGLPQWLYDELKQLAEKERRSLPGYIHRILWQHAENISEYKGLYYKAMEKAED